MVRCCLAFAVLVAVLPACDGDAPPPDGNLILLVELKTDLVPGVEFAAVRTQLFDPADRTDELTRRQVDVTLGRDLTSGLRVAELGDLAVGTYLVRVTLVDLADAAVLGRDVMVTVRETAGVTVLMTRDCLGVMCPGTGSDPTETACLGGRCVEERCTPETPEFCPVPECSAAADCTEMVSACAEWACEDGTCLVRSETAMCTSVDEYCDPTSGCLPVPTLADAGVGDAGDAGDASMGMIAWVEAANIKATNPDANDEFGHAVSLSADGNTLVISARQEDSAAIGVGGDAADDTTSDAGAVYVFVRTREGWEQEAYLKASNTDAGDEFGSSLSLSADGNTLAVGAIGERSAATGVGVGATNNTARDAGAVYVFVRRGASWMQEAYVKASNTDADDQFGYAVSLSSDGDRLAVSAVMEDSVAIGVGGDATDDTALNAGAVYVFARTGTNWTEEAYLKASNTDAGDQFGFSVSLSADSLTLAVGAPREESAAMGVRGDATDDAARSAGAVYVFAHAGGAWGQVAYLKASNTDAGDQFGCSVSLSADGTTLAAGARLEDSAATGVGGDQTDDTASTAGAVYVFARIGTTWAQEAYVKASNTASGDNFGHAVSLSGDGNALAVGAWQESRGPFDADGIQSDEVMFRSGAVYVYERSGATWTHQDYLKASNASLSAYFGWSVSLDDDGDALLVGAPWEATTGGAHSGALYTFGS